MREGPQGRARVAELLRNHGIRPRRRLGQNFLVDPNVTRKLVGLAGVGAGDQVLEIGAGTGTLTRALAESGATVRTYEVDERLRPILEAELAGTGVEIIFEDGMLVDFAGSLRGSWTMVSNLPYGVGTPLLMRMLRGVPQVVRYVVMLQKEVVDRLVSAPGDRVYGLPSVVVALHAETTAGFRVAPQVFLPAPPVESTVVVLERKSDIPPLTGRAVELAESAFGQRRKMVRSSLGRALGPSASEILAEAEIPSSARAEQIAPGGYLRIAEVEADHAA